MRNVGHRLAVFLVLSVCCRADLTLRYTVKVGAGDTAPPAQAKALAQLLAPSAPPDKTIRIKGDKALLKVGMLTAIIENGSPAITLLNPATKQYAQLSTPELIDGLQAEIPASSTALAKYMQVDAQTRKTGQFEIVSGIRGEEHLITVTMSKDAPAAAGDPLNRTELHTWLASQDELNSIPTLRGYAPLAQRALNLSAIGDAVDNHFPRVLGAALMLRAVTQEVAGNADSLTLKTQLATYSTRVNPGASTLTITVELAEISSGAIDDSTFQMPPDFQRSSAAELLKPLTPVISGIIAGQQAGVTGGSVTAPSIIYKRDPEYSEKARRAKLSGSVTLKLIVDKEGLPRNIQVVQSLGMGLDEKAIEAVKQWRFRPGQKDGQPVNEIVRVQVNFGLLNRPPEQ